MTSEFDADVTVPATSARWPWTVGLQVARNAPWLTIGIGVASLVDVLLAVYLGRTFGAADYGRFMFAFALASVFSVLFDFGLSTVATRALARNPAEERDVVFPYSRMYAGGSGPLLKGACTYGRPVVVADVSEVGPLVRSHNIGLIAAPDDPSSPADAMRSFARLDEDERNLLAENSAMFARANSWDHLASRLTRVFESIRDACAHGG